MDLATKKKWKTSTNISKYANVPNIGWILKKVLRFSKYTANNKSYVTVMKLRNTLITFDVMLKRETIL